MNDGTKLWLWKNGDHYLAFEHRYPCFTQGGDPMTLGEPSGFAIFKRSFNRARQPALPAAQAASPDVAKMVAERVVKVIEDAYDCTEQSVPRDFCGEATDAAYGAVLDALGAAATQARAAAGSEPVAWGIFAMVDGKWALQFPVYGSKHLALRDTDRFADSSALEVRPLSELAAPPATPVAEPGTAGEDARMLDWLETQKQAYGFADVHEGNNWLVEGPYRTVREAIRAAMKESSHD